VDFILLLAQPFLHRKFVAGTLHELDVAVHVEDVRPPGTWLYALILVVV
jgi:hypothetical protein